MRTVYYDDDDAAQVTEELRELAIARYYRDRSPQRSRAYLNQSGKYTDLCASR